MIEDILTLFGAGDVANEFRRMEVAEQEVERARHLYPDKQDALWRCWVACRSPHIPSTAPMSIFRTHCRQFLRNLAEGVDVDQPTLVEVACMTLRAFTNTVPPKHELAMMFQSDEETVHAFGPDLEPLAAYDRIGEELWPELQRVNRSLYTRLIGQTRGELVKDALRDGGTPWPLKKDRLPPRQADREVSGVEKALQLALL